MADVESKSIPHELSSSHWLKATGQCVLERYLSATMQYAPHFFKVGGIKTGPKRQIPGPKFENEFNGISRRTPLQHVQIESE